MVPSPLTFTAGLSSCIEDAQLLGVWSESLRMYIRETCRRRRGDDRQVGGDVEIAELVRHVLLKRLHLKDLGNGLISVWGTVMVGIGGPSSNSSFRPSSALWAGK